MRFLLTLAVLDDVDTDTDTAAVEEACEDMWGELYLHESDPVPFTTVGGRVLTREQVVEIRDALIRGYAGVTDAAFAADHVRVAAAVSLFDTVEGGESRG